MRKDCVVCRFYTCWKWAAAMAPCQVRLGQTGWLLSLPASTDFKETVVSWFVMGLLIRNTTGVTNISQRACVGTVCRVCTSFVKRWTVRQQIWSVGSGVMSTRYLTRKAAHEVEWRKLKQADWAGRSWAFFCRKLWRKRSGRCWDNHWNGNRVSPEGGVHVSFQALPKARSWVIEPDLLGKSEPGTGVYQSHHWLSRKTVWWEVGWKEGYRANAKAGGRHCREAKQSKRNPDSGRFRDATLSQNSDWKRGSEMDVVPVPRKWKSGLKPTERSSAWSQGASIGVNDLTDVADFLPFRKLYHWQCSW